MVKYLGNGNKIIYNNHGYIFYYDSNGRFHRTDGPAYIHKNGKEEFYLHGIKVNSLTELIIKNIIE